MCITTSFLGQFRKEFKYENFSLGRRPFIKNIFLLCIFNYELWDFRFGRKDFLTYTLISLYDILLWRTEEQTAAVK